MRDIRNQSGWGWDPVNSVPDVPLDVWVKYVDVTALPGRSEVLGFVKRSRLGCHTGSSVWGGVKGFQGSRWQRSGCQGALGVQGGFWVQGETLVDC